MWTCQGKEEEGGQRWKYAFKRDMTEAGLKRTTGQTGHNGGISSSAIPAIPDDGTSQGRRIKRIL